LFDFETLSYPHKNNAIITEMRKFSVSSVIFVLVAVMLTNGIGISFKAEVFAHELDHIRQSLASNPGAHLDAHRNSAIMDDAELDAATHLCLHAAGQYQPFYFLRIALVPPLAGKETLTPYIASFLPDSIPESPYHPPRILA
jgi:hypothetical protein